VADIIDVALNTLKPHPDYVGIICTKANVHDICHEAIENARYVCEEHFGLFKGPPIQLLCPKDLTFPYIPGHLSHICFELLKNSLRAVVERYGVDNEDSFPPVKVIVVEGSEDITIKISDEGGGIPRSALPMIWTYLYTTMSDEGIQNELSVSTCVTGRSRAGQRDVPPQTATQRNATRSLSQQGNLNRRLTDASSRTCPPPHPWPGMATASPSRACTHGTLAATFV
jgi:hypothetical protein